MSGIVAGAALALVLTACGSESSEPADAGSALSTTSCPTAAPDDAGDPQWTLDGDTGSIAVIGSTDSATPSVQVEAPFSVSETQVHTLSEGSGPVVEDTAQVSVCYMGVNGRDGSVFDSSYERGAPAEFPLTGVVTGFQKAIAGQTVGSKVAVAMTSADGYPDGQPRAGIEAGDSLVFVLDILEVTG
ncbi:peptidylprolyl isomerase [Rhodococcus sp. Eu-32]|nr:peptidylprolyl isomerase [Rhodococcus sp. Eu-32]